MKRMRDIDEAAVSSMVDRYREGSTMDAIALDFGVSKSTVWKALRLSGVVSRNQGREHMCDDHYFDHIDSPTKAYWLGFIAADGNVAKDGNALKIGIHAKDIELLHGLREDLKATNPIYTMNGRDVVQFDVASPTLHAGLVKHGIIPCKTLILEPPLFLPTELAPHYIRGYSDGDGCIYARRGDEKWVVLGTKQVLEWIAASIESACGFSVSRPTQVGNIWRLNIAGAGKVSAVRDYLYPCGLTRCLERKRLAFESVTVRSQVLVSAWRRPRRNLA